MHGTWRELPEGSRLRVVELSAERMVLQIPAGGWGARQHLYLPLIWAVGLAPFFLMLPFVFRHSLGGGIFVVLLMLPFVVIGTQTFRKAWRLGTQESILLVEPDRLAIQSVASGEARVYQQRFLHRTDHIELELIGENFGTEVFGIVVYDARSRLKFGEQLAGADQEWIVHRMKELLGQRFRNECPICEAELLVTEIDPVSGRQRCEDCGWLSKEWWGTPTASDPTVDQEFWGVRVPRNVRVVEQSPDWLAVEVKPSVGHSIGCGTLIALVAIVSVAIIFSRPIPGGLEATILGLGCTAGIVAILTLIAVRNVFCTEQISFDRASRCIRYRVTWGYPQTRVLSEAARVEWMEPEVVTEVASARRHIDWSNHGTRPVSIWDRCTSTYLSFAGNQPPRVQHWLRDAFRAYVHPGGVNRDETTRGFRSAEGDTRWFFDRCPRCGERFVPSMVDVDARTLVCSRGMTCGWGRWPEVWRNTPRERLPWMVQGLERLEDWLMRIRPRN